MYYVYPKGVTGEQLALMMEDIDGIKVDFIDDSDKELCFDAKKAKISSDDVVYVALSRLSLNYEENLKNIVERLERHKINYILGGVIEYAKKSICKIKEECRNEGIEKIVCLVMAGFAKNKHFGNLGEVLAQKLACSGRGGGFSMFVLIDFLISSIYK